MSLKKFKLAWFITSVLILIYCVNEVQCAKKFVIKKKLIKKAIIGQIIKTLLFKGPKIIIPVFLPAKHKSTKNRPLGFRDNLLKINGIDPSTVWDSNNPTSTTRPSMDLMGMQMVYPIMEFATMEEINEMKQRGLLK